MAQWQYATIDAELESGVDFDEELHRILDEYGMKGWELVQVLQPKAIPATIWSLRLKGR
jgi:hypothetical protein